MNRVAIVLLWAATVSACQSATYAPSTPTAQANPQDPFAINLSVAVGTGANADHATIGASVQGPTGLALPGVTVAFATTQGTLTSATGVTDAKGTATTTLVATVVAQVTVTAGKISVQREVATQPPTSSTTPPTAPPIPTPTPAPIPGSLVLNMASSGTTNVAVSMFVSGSSNAGPIGWSFGDGATDQTASYATSHTYSTAGTYTVTATGIGIGKSSSATITIANP